MDRAYSGRSEWLTELGRTKTFRKVMAFVEHEGLVARGDRIAVGVSGGADSVCLLLFLAALRADYELDIHVVHVNHGIREVAADYDERFVKELCEELSIPCVIYKADIPSLAREHGTGEEEEGRNFRYKSFDEVCERYGLNKIAVAHNLDDNAETVVFNMARGTGFRGTAGIRSRKDRDGRAVIVRPLLCLTKSEITSVLDDFGRKYCTDETNLNLEYSRNRIRNEILPLLSEFINSSAKEHIAAFAEDMSELVEYVDCEVSRNKKELTAASMYGEEEGAAWISVEALKNAGGFMRRELIRSMIAHTAGRLKDITAAHIEAVEELAFRQSGRSADLPYGLRASRSFEIIRISTETERAVLPEELVEVELDVMYYDGSSEVPKSNCIKWFDYDKIDGIAETRTMLPGDYIKVRTGSDGRLGKKPISDALAELRIPKEDRAKVPLLAVGHHIIWIIGGRGTADYYVTKDTKRVLVAQYIKENIQ